MRKGAGKSKGAAFERWACKRFSLWVSGGERDDVFWRSAMSGGRATLFLKRSKKKGHAQAGDISAVHKIGAPLVELFFIECKFYRDLQIMSAGIKDQGNLLKFWKTARKQAKAAGKLPMLVVKQNGIEPLLCVNSKGFNRLFKFNDDDNTITRIYMPKYDLFLIMFERLLREPYSL